MVDSSRYIALRLQKERQDEDAALARQALQQRNMQFLISQGMDAAQSIGGQMARSGARSKQDGIANTLMNQSDPPRAEAVNPNAPGVARANQTYGGPTAAHTGGMDEMRFNLAMDDNKRRNMAAGLSEQREGRMRQSADDMYLLRKEEAATRAAKAATEKTRGHVTDANAYFKTADALRTRMSAAQQAGDFDAYNTAAQELQAAYWGTKSAGGQLPELQIPEFVGPSPENQGAFNTAMDNWKNTRGAAMQKDGWDSGGRVGIPLIRESVPSNGERFMQASEELNKQKSAFVKRPVTEYKPDDDFIPLPASAPASSQGGNAVTMAKQAIASGADPQAVAERLRAMGIDPTLLNK